MSPPPLRTTTATTAFATPVPRTYQSEEVLEWRFPRPWNNYVLTGRSRAAWHTSFVIPQLNLLLDAGLCVNRERPKHIFLTHGHCDHTLLAPTFVKRDDPPDIFCPAEMRHALDEFVRAKTLLNLGGHLTVDEVEEADREKTKKLQAEEGTEGEDTDDGNNHHHHQSSTGVYRRLLTHVTHGIQDGDVVDLRRTKNITAQAFRCDHTVPCLGYVFRATTNRLKPEYTPLQNDGEALKKLRESGVEITAPVTTPMFAFLGDTTAATLAADPSWLRDGIAVVITECSFLDERHRARAAKTKHTIWADLEKVIRSHPKTTFVLMHFSLRYEDEDIRRFFTQMEDPPSNIVVWIDGQPADTA
ncbi:ribonuclease Z-like protein [Diplogelasinospora grovesii]|uniref:Ribonuclease Z-like protein n=1 Tax=Diplogelasinospora grovesii TaxID=303347 RepID=A0AAN6N825_9PEZI|nr:ribonuclease Z-like protein [Diplogelasinospora grovesii]